MTYRQLHEFYTGEVAWYSRQNEFCKGQIDYCTRQLKRLRQEDRELAAYALESEPDDPLTRRIFGGKYVGTETRKVINERNKYYREIKKNTARIEHFRREADEIEKYVG